MRAKVLTLVKSPPEFPQGLAWKGCERYRAKVKLGDIGTTALDVHPKVDAVRALNSLGLDGFSSRRKRTIYLVADVTRRACAVRS